MIGRRDCCGTPVTTGRALADVSKTWFPTQAPARGWTRAWRAAFGDRMPMRCMPTPRRTGAGRPKLVLVFGGLPGFWNSSRLLFPLPPFTFNA